MKRIVALATIVMASPAWGVGSTRPSWERTSPAVVPEISAQVADLWQQEGDALKQIAAISTGTDKGEALLRLGEWERGSVERLRNRIEEGRLAASMGQTLINQHLDAARRAYTEAEALASPTRLPEVLFSLGDLLRFRNDPEDARVPLSKLVDEHPENPLAVDAATALGDDAFDAGHLAEAMRRYEFAATRARSPGARGYAQYKLAWCYLNLSEYEKARSLFLNVITLSEGGRKAITLADEARRDFVLALARDSAITAVDAERQIRALALNPERTRRYIEGYANIIASAGRDPEAATVLSTIEAEAPPADGARIFTAELQIAIRERNLGAEERSASRLAQAVQALHGKLEDAGDAAERALRVAAVTVHGEGRARGDRRMMETAAHLYEDYFAAFDSSPEAYELHHHAGELFARLDEPAAAERQYSAAVMRDLTRLAHGQQPGKWLESSAQGAVTAAQDALPQVPSPPHPTPPSENEVTVPPPAPTPLSRPEQIFVAACDRYLKALPHAAQAVDVRYQRALVFYRHNYLGQAEEELRRVAMDHPTDPSATYAAELSMDALRQLRRYDELADLTLQMQRVPALRRILGRDLEATHEAALLAAAAWQASIGHYSQAAGRYLAFVKAYPGSTRLDRALYNGAAALVDDGRLAEGVALRERLLRDLPKSPLAERARQRQLSELLMLGRFAQSERLATELAGKGFGVQGATHLHDAVVLAEAAGDLRGADRLRSLYIKRHRAGQDTMPYAVTLAKHAHGCASRLRASRRALALAPDSGWRTIALTELAREELSCHEETNGRIHASEAAAMAPRLKRSRGDALDASAEAALMMTTPAVEAYRKLPVREPYARTLPRKLAALKAADDRLARVIARGRATPAVCALVRSGRMYSDLARALSTALAPRRFNANERALFKEQLAEKSQPLFDRAKKTLLQAIARARDAGIAPECLGDGRRTLAALWPQRFGPSDEVIAQLAPTPVAVKLGAEDILERAPDAPPAWLIAARSELAAQRPQAAIVLLNRIDKADPLYPEALEVKARALAASGRHDAALAAWIHLAQAYPSRPLAHRVLADRALANRDLEGAKPQLMALLRENSADAAVDLDLGIVLQGLGDATGAERNLRAALRIEPQNPAASLDLGMLLCGDGGRPGEGIAALQRYLASGQKPPDARRFEATLAACRALAQESKQ